MSKRTVIARIPIGHDEIVISLDDRDRIDVRVHTLTGGLHFPSNNALTLRREHLAALIEALEGAMRKEAAA